MHFKKKEQLIHAGLIKEYPIGRSVLQKYFCEIIFEKSYSFLE
jgi:hypothetical protein